MIALTTTVTTKTRLQIVKTLETKNPALIVNIPNRQNIAYCVQIITPNPSVTFANMVSDLKVQKTSYERTIIYCLTIKLKTHPYGFFQAELSEQIYADESQDPKKRIVEMFHSRSDELNKEEILKSSGDSSGCIRVLIRTIAYGMGIDCKDVKKLQTCRKWSSGTERSGPVQINYFVLKYNGKALSRNHVYLSQTKKKVQKKSFFGEV